MVIFLMSPIFCFFRIKLPLFYGYLFEVTHLLFL